MIYALGENTVLQGYKVNYGTRQLFHGYCRDFCQQRKQWLIVMAYKQ